MAHALHTDAAEAFKVSARNILIVPVVSVLVACGPAKTPNSEPVPNAAPAAYSSPAFPYTEPKYAASLVLEGGIRDGANLVNHVPQWRHRVCFQNGQPIQGSFTLDFAQLGTPIARDQESSVLNFNFYGSARLKATALSTKDTRKGTLVTVEGVTRQRLQIPRTFIRSEAKSAQLREKFSKILDLDVKEEQDVKETIHRYLIGNYGYYLRIRVERYFFSTELGALGKLAECEARDDISFTETLSK